MDNKLLIPPSIFIGELFPWKGKFWKVQLYDQAGGMIQVDGETQGLRRLYRKTPSWY